MTLSIVGCGDASSPASGTVSFAVKGDAPGSGVRPECDPDNGGLTLPPGFCALVVADDVGRARHMAVAPNGDLFVAIDNPPGTTSGGGVLALRDTDGDGKPDLSHFFGSTGGHGIAFKDGFLYFAPNDRVERFVMSEESLVPVSGPDVIVSGLPADGDHVTKTIVLDGAGGMFVNIGSASDVCQVVNRQPGSPGVDPCPELPIRAGVWLFAADMLGQTQADGTHFAIGTRNMVALTMNPRNDTLYGVQHGRDNLNVYWPDLFTPEDQAELPSEEFFVFESRGAEYGWPYCYHDGRQNLKVLGPEYGGDGQIVGRCAAMENPILAFPAHWAPNGVHFYTGVQFPPKYQRGAFVAFHGGFNRAPLPNEGFNVVFVPFAGERPAGTFEVFADGFVGTGTSLPGDAEHRPVGLAEAPDGSLFISDDVGGRVWRVLHANRRR